MKNNLDEAPAWDQNTSPKAAALAAGRDESVQRDKAYTSINIMNKSHRSRNTQHNDYEGTVSKTSFRHMSPVPDSVSKDGLLLHVSGKKLRVGTEMFNNTSQR